MTQFLVKKVSSSLHPYDDASWEAFDKLPRDKPLLITVKQSRNPEFLARYWAILSVAVDHSDAWVDRDDVHHWLRVQVPWMRDSYMIEEDGTMVVTLKSTAIDSMKEDEFERYYERAMELISEKIGTDIESLAAEVWNRKRKETGR